ncbi:MAG TPA: SDR family NAD(P)-dependent oxidoreductase [Vicinamibacteria bacterium]|nr:SDR family NAD(P)-dependent oxidoreductase [Vicinamibacteria bacterium]
MSFHPPAEPAYDGSEIAVVGMAGRFPGAPDVEAFWRNLREGVESITVFSEEDLLKGGEDRKHLEDPRYVRVRPILDDVEMFDAAFFGFTPREAEILDPQHRLFLECAWTALEHAGHDPERFPGPISLFAGASFSNYLVHNLYRNRPRMEAFGDLQATLFNVQDSLVTMVGYKLNLKGACCAVQTFCSTSLVAVHLACQNLLNHESDLALAGGVTIYVPQQSGYLYEEGSIVSPDGHCRSFDARAGGTVFGNGLGVVVLRRLEDALADGDSVHAIIRGSAVNNDGSLRVSFGAPGVVGQTEVVVEALSAAGVDPSTVGYVEAHGTGTRLGDPAEVAALTRAFRTGTDRRRFCALGSVKGNVGHLDAASGVTSLIKVILAFQHGEIPPSLHFQSPNPGIDLSDSPFFVNATLRPWPRDGVARRAGVHTFGVGGTNAHVILEEAPAMPSAPSARRHHLLLLSARTEEALVVARHRLAAYLEAQPELNLADVAYTLQVGRRAFAHRGVLVAATAGEAASLLRTDGPGVVCDLRNPPIVLRLATSAPPPVGTGRDLYEQEPVFRDALLSCVEAAGETGRRMRDALFPAAPEAQAAGRALVEPQIGSLATFALEYASARLLQSWGLRFEAIEGEGVGARVAACLQGVMELAGAVRSGGPNPEAAGSTAEPASGGGRFRIELDGGRVTTRDAIRGSEAPAIRASLSSAQLLEVLGRLWLSGVELDWRAVHAPEARRRVPLPTYPFERSRFWVDPLEEEAKPADEKMEPELYRPIWKTALPAAAEPAGPGQLWLLFIDPEGLGASIAKRLNALAAEVITIAAGARFTGDPERGYTIDPSQPRDYSLLWEDLHRRRRLPAGVIHLWSVEAPDPQLSSPERFRRACDLGFFSLLHLTAARGGGPLALKVVTAGLHEVVGGEALAPEKAPLLGLCRVLPQEDPEVTCAVIDVEPAVGGHEGLADRLVAELGLPRPEPVTAYRRGHRWVQDYDWMPEEDDPLGADADALNGSRARAGGVYLITGGLGDIGFVLGIWLVQQARARLVLTGRTGLPPRAQWGDWLASHEPTERTALRIRKVQALEGLGAEVLVVAADVADVTAMGSVVRAAHERFGALHGVIHAAGVLDADSFRVARELGREACDRQFLPKVRGLLALEEVLRGEELDFCLLISSLSTALGGVGYAAYAGANAFLDAFATSASREGNAAWVSVNWDQWALPGRVEAAWMRGLATEGPALMPEQALRGFSRLLRLRRLDRLLVSAGRLEARLGRRGKPLPTPPALSAAAGARPRPPLGSEYLAPRSEAERRLAGIWQELLGLETLGIHDDFFELGGHSLFAARVLSRVREVFGVSLPVEVIFDARTIAQLATQVETATWAKGGAGPGGATGERVEIEL